MTTIYAIDIKNTPSAELEFAQRLLFLIGYEWSHTTRQLLTCDKTEIIPAEFINRDCIIFELGNERSRIVARANNDSSMHRYVCVRMPKTLLEIGVEAAAALVLLGANPFEEVKSQ